MPYVIKTKNKYIANIGNYTNSLEKAFVYQTKKASKEDCDEHNFFNKNSHKVIKIKFEELEEIKK